MDSAKKTEKDNNIYLNRIIKPFFFLICAIVFEIINFITLFVIYNKGSIDSYVQVFPTYIFFDLSIIICIAAIIYIVKKTAAANTIFYIFIGIQFALNITNSIMYTSSGIVFSFEMFALANEGLTAFNFSFVNATTLILNIVALAVTIILQIYIDKTTSRKVVNLKKISRIAFSLVCFFICYIFGISAYTIQVYTMDRDVGKYIYSDLNFKAYSLKQFGTYGFYAKNLYNIVFKNNVNKLDMNQLKNDLDNQSVSANPDAKLYDDNLIVIMLESFEWFAIDPYNTPTLWNISQNSVAFTNYYSNNKTNVSEDICNLGYMPNDTKFNISSPDTLASKYSLPNLFNEMGYKTGYFHSYVSTFYNRHIINKNMGYSNLTFLDDVNFPNKSTTFGAFNNESSFFDCVKNDLAPTDQKFMSFYLTVSSHGGYEKTNDKFIEFYDQYDDNLETTDFVEWFEAQGYKYPTDTKTEQLLRNYKSAAMDTDRMLAKLIEHLNTATNSDGSKLIDNTSIVLFADHNSYYHDLSYTIKGTDKNIYSQKESHRVPFMIYSKKLQNKSIDMFVNSYDLFPTICELYGLPYNKFFTLGYDVFDNSKNYHLYYSALTGFYKEEFYSSNLIDIQVDSKRPSDDKILEFRTNMIKFYEKYQYIDKVYRSKIKNLSWKFCLNLFSLKKVVKRILKNF